MRPVILVPVAGVPRGARSPPATVLVGLDLLTPGSALALGALGPLQLSLAVLQFASSRFELQVVPFHLAKLLPNLFQFLLIDSILTAVLQSPEPFFRRGQLLERVRHLQMLLLLLDETLLQFTDLIESVLVLAARLTPRRRNQFAPPLFDDLRQLSATPAAEDHADLGLKPRAQAGKCRIGQIRPAEGLSLLHPQDAPHAKRLRGCAPVAGLGESQEVAQLVFGGVRLEQRSVGTSEARVGVLYESLCQRITRRRRLQRPVPRPAPRRCGRSAAL